MDRNILIFKYLETERKIIITKQNFQNNPDFVNHERTYQTHTLIFFTR